MPSKWPANLWMKMMTKMKMKIAVNPQGIVQWKLKIPNFPQKKIPTHVIVKPVHRSRCCPPARTHCLKNHLIFGICKCCENETFSCDFQTLCLESSFIYFSYFFLISSAKEIEIRFQSVVLKKIPWQLESIIVCRPNEIECV